MGLLFICKHIFMLKSKLKVDYWLTIFVQSKERRFTACVYIVLVLKKTIAWSKFMQDFFD